MLRNEVLAALNKQIQHELMASHSYLAASIWFEEQILKGFASYMRKQAREEQGHAMRFVDYVQSRNGKITLGGIEAPKTEFASVIDVLKHVRALEHATTASINALHTVAVKQDDLATQNALQWFIKEQVEEEQWAEEFVAMAEKVASHTGALFMLDHHVSKRVTE